MACEYFIRYFHDINGLVMNEACQKDNLIVTLSFELAVEVVDFCDVLEQMRKWAIANQIVRAGLSVGANVNEAQNAESKADFIHKMKIAAKEVEELQFCFSICNAAQSLPDAHHLQEKTTSVSRVLNKIIGTAKRSVHNQ